MPRLGRYSGSWGGTSGFASGFASAFGLDGCPGDAAGCHDDAAQFIAFLTLGNRNYLVPEDFVPLIQDVVDTHPGLLFLKEATEFHSRYVHTVSIHLFSNIKIYLVS